MTLRVFWLLLCILSLSAATGMAQGNYYNFSKVDIDNGLSHNQVYTIYRDTSGFVWFGTGSGLNRFDGHDCKVFVNVAGDSTSLKENYVAEIFPLPDGKLWIGSKTEGCIYDPLTEKFDHNYQAYLKKLCLPPGRIVNSIIDNQGNYWFLFEKEGLYKFTPSSKTAARFSTSSKDFPITAFSKDEQGHLWLIRFDGYIQQINPFSSW